MHVIIGTGQQQEKPAGMQICDCRGNERQIRMRFDGI